MQINKKILWGSGIVAVIIAGYVIAISMDSSSEPTKTSTQNPQTSPTAATNSVATSLVTVESTEKEATYYRVAADGVKTKIFSIPSDDGDAFSWGTITPDQKAIIYTDDDRNLQSYNLDTGKSTLIKASVPFNSSNVGESLSFGNSIKVSPNGKHLLAMWLGYECAGIAFMNIDGSNFEQINGCAAGEFDWSPDSKKFVIANPNNDFGGEPAALYVADTSAPKAGKQILPKNAASSAAAPGYNDVGTPKFSPDGKKIAISYNYRADTSDASIYDSRYYREIYVVNVDGTNFTRITNNESMSADPIWKDNSTLIYGLSPYYSGTKKMGLYSVGIDGKNTTSLFTDTFTKYDLLAVSDDGQEIIYFASQADKNGVNQITSTLYSVNINTQQKTKLSQPGQVIGFVGFLK